MFLMKKLVSALFAIVLALTLSVAAFAETDYAGLRQQAKDALTSRGYTAFADQVDANLTNEVIDKMIAKYETVAGFQAAMEKYEADVKAAKSVEEVTKIVNNAKAELASVGINITIGTITINGSNVTVPVTWGSATVNPSVKIAATSAPSNNLNQGNDVIRQTGDVVGFVVLVSVLAVAGILGLAVRKSQQLG